jgi:hypothetical protein
MILFALTVDGVRYRCEAHTYSTGSLLLIKCPGLASFDAVSIAEARDIIHGALRKEASQ